MTENRITPPEYRYSGRTKLYRYDLTGQRFGRLLVLEYTGRKITNEKKNSGYSMWLCRCDCGAPTIVSSHSLRDGTTKSCGCLAKETARNNGGHNILPQGQSAFNQLYGAYKKSARERGYEFSLTKDQFHTITQQDCFYCGAKPEIKFRAAKGTNGNYIGNGVDRIDNNAGYTPENVRPCCTICNTAKMTLSESEFYSWIERVYSKHFTTGPNQEA